MTYMTMMAPHLLCIAMLPVDVVYESSEGACVACTPRATQAQ